MQVFPVRKSYDSAKDKWRKHPAVPKGESWKTYRASEAEMRHAENFGVVIPQGRVVLDLDSYKGVSVETVDKVLGVALDWDAALVQRTVSGGQHYCFVLPEGMTIKQGDNLLGVEGFDSRASGLGWICTGAGYQDETIGGMPEALFEEPFPEIPAEVVERINGGGDALSDDGFDLEQVLAEQPLEGVSLEDAKLYMAKLPKGDVDHYGTWLKVGMALHHQFAGSDEAKALWVEWSKGSADYDKAEIDAKWPTFGNRDHVTQPARFDYVIHRAGGRAVTRVSLVDRLTEQAAEVDSHEKYEAFKRDVLKTSLADLPLDARQMVGKALYEAFGKNAGITASAVKAALKPSRKALSGVVEDRERERPDWVSEWVYCEVPCEFYHLDLHYAIKREAFNAKFDRLPDVIEAEKSAAAYALTNGAMDTVVDKMFWPGASETFEHEGMSMVNTYRAPLLEPPTALDDDGQGVVDMFLSHLAMTVEDPREQGIILDWMTWVYQNPGQRVNWALLLQGAQGSGKSYFASVLQMLMGRLVTSLDPTAIAGRFTGWAHGSLVVVVEEVRISGTNKYEVLDRMKPFITNAVVQIEEKGRDHRTVPNFTSYMMLTNHKDAIPLTQGDRRYCVIFGRIQSEEQLYSELGGEKAAGAYFDRLFSETERRCDALAHFFAHRELSEGFSPRGRAPDTDAKRRMQSVAVSPERMQVEEALSACECEVVNEDVVDITWLHKLAEIEQVELPKTRALSAVLLEMGYEQIDKRRVKINKTGRLHYVWWRPGGKFKTCGEARKFVRDYHDDDDFIPF
ncbi:MAG: DUF5906 domain-containing protein [Acidiferrobacterales bacterium]|nr:DUF5906 domain-containing protein [Acidiferrobacterales bacterium]